MAIAYFIPDQTKLLAGANAGSTTTTNNNQHNATNNGSHSGAATNGHAASGPTAAGPAGPTAATNATGATATAAAMQSNHHHNHHFRANISIPLSGADEGADGAGEQPQNNSHSQDSNATIGCWELLAQLFCYALRFYQQAHLSPAMIQISFEITGSSSSDHNATAPASASQTASQEQADVTQQK